MIKYYGVANKESVESSIVAYKREVLKRLGEERIITMIQTTKK